MDEYERQDLVDDSLRRMEPAPSNSAHGAMLSPSATKIEVYSGGFVDVAKPEPTTIELEDIARGLGFTCRYGGHVKRFYSVAEHAVLVHDLMRSQGATRQQLLGALFHDAAEAYLGDVVAPLKYALRAGEAGIPFGTAHPDYIATYRCVYDSLSSRMDRAIAERFGLESAHFESDDLRVADMWALRIEARTLTRTGGQHWRWPGELPNAGELPTNVMWAGSLTPGVAADVWLRAAHQHLPSEARDAA